MRSPAQSRQTSQRALIADALRTAKGFRSAQALHQDITRAGGRVGLTTVYRALQAMSADGSVDVLFSSTGEARYRMCSREDHHHHLVCKKCGKSVEVEAQEVERWVHATARSHGYRLTDHTAEVYGVCPSCD